LNAAIKRQHSVFKIDQRIETRCEADWGWMRPFGEKVVMYCDKVELEMSNDELERLWKAVNAARNSVTNGAPF
jgi:hypothetical protein